MKLTLVLLVLVGYVYAADCRSNNKRGNDDENVSAFYRCVKTVLSLTQSCDNENKAFATIMGNTSGFGSEFLAYLMQSLFSAMMSNRRFIFLRSKKPWEYDCENNSAWGCYLAFGPCKGGVVDSAGIDISKAFDYDQYPKNSGSEVINRNSMKRFYQEEAERHMSRLQDIMKNAYAKTHPELASVCLESTVQLQGDIKKFEVSSIAGLLARQLYQVTDEMQAYIDHANDQYFQTMANHKVPLSPYMTSERRQAAHRPPLYHYAAIQLRLTDKRYETPDNIWPLISDMRNVARSVLTMLRDYQHFNPSHPKLTHIFIATDNCTAAGELAHYIRHTALDTLPVYSRSIPGFESTNKNSNNVAMSDSSKYFFLGSCFQSDGKHIVEEKRSWNPRSDPKNVFLDPPPQLSKYTTATSASSSSGAPAGSVDMRKEDHRPAANTVSVMADIDMLRHGAVFMGSFYSNFVRLVHYLRVPNQHQFSYHLLIDDKDFQDRNNMKTHF